MPSALCRKPSRRAQAPRIQLKEPLLLFARKSGHAVMKNCVWQRLVATQQHEVVAIRGDPEIVRWTAITALR
jgi:hypothetical protein